jgi:hypothetical protein
MSRDLGRPAGHDAAVERIVTLTLETTPRDATHWSTRAMSRQAAPQPFVWTKTADEVLASVARSCHRISDSGHQTETDIAGSACAEAPARV